MSAPRTLVWATTDVVRGVALITGIGNLLPVLDYADLRATTTWSPSGRGWVVPLGSLSDLACACDVMAVPFRERQREAS
jgi:hypothetical protein